jgi:hypothetical protein
MLLFGTWCAVPAKAAPEIQLDRESISGLETGGADTEFSFHIRNSGDQDLIIGKVTASCGCTTAELPQRVIPPGRQVELKGVYHPDDSRPTFAVFLLVQSNAPNAPLKRLAVAGRNYPEDIEMSATFLEFQCIEGAHAAPRNFSLKTRKALSLKKVECISKAANGESPAEIFSVRDVRTSTHEVSCIVVAQTPSDIGRYKATLRLDVVIDRKSKRFDVPLVLENARAFLLAPPQVRIPSRAHSDRYSARVLVKHHTGEAFSVRSVKTPTAAIETSLKKNSPSAYFVYLSVVSASDLPDTVAPVCIEIEQS